MILRMFDIPTELRIEYPYTRAVNTIIYDVAQVHSINSMEENYINEHGN